MDIIDQIWKFQYSLVPCLVAYTIFDMPIILRRVTRKLYAPIYFAFFPFGYSDELYARYFDEDHMYVLGGPLEENEVSNARNRIILISVLSLVITIIISPLFAALFSHYALSASEQTQFLYTLAIVKFILLGKSLYNLHWEYKITSIVPIYYVGAMYAAYLLSIITIYIETLSWIEKTDDQGGFIAILSGLAVFFVYEILLKVIIVGIVGYLISWRLTKGTAQPRDTGNV